MDHPKLDSAESLRASADDPEAFVRFYDAHSKTLLAYFVRRTYEAEVAVDSEFRS